MYALYYKELYIVKEPLTKNRTFQSWRGKQIAICEEKQPLIDYVESLDLSESIKKEKFYIEKMAF